MWTVEMMNFASTGEKQQNGFEFHSRGDAVAFMRSANAFMVRMLDPDGNQVEQRVINIPIEQQDPLPQWK
jgi:hypothetical protein